MRSAAARGWPPTKPASSPGSPIGRCETGLTRPSAPAVSSPSRCPASDGCGCRRGVRHRHRSERVQPVVAPPRRPPRRLLRRRDRHRAGRGRAPAIQVCTCSRTVVCTSRPRRSYGSGNCSSLCSPADPPSCWAGLRGPLADHHVPPGEPPEGQQNPRLAQAAVAICVHADEDDYGTRSSAVDQHPRRPPIPRRSAGRTTPRAAADGTPPTTSGAGDPGGACFGVHAGRPGSRHHIRRRGHMW